MNGLSSSMLASFCMGIWDSAIYVPPTLVQTGQRSKRPLRLRNTNIVHGDSQTFCMHAGDSDANSRDGGGNLGAGKLGAGKGEGCCRLG